jgi:spermidine/putrescine-binding protein
VLKALRKIDAYKAADTDIQASLKRSDVRIAMAYSLQPLQITLPITPTN